MIYAWEEMGWADGILELAHQGCPSNPERNRWHLNSVDVLALQRDNIS